MRSWRSWAPSPRKCSRTQPALRLGPASVRANESASKRRSGCGRAGNAVLRATLTECALGAVRTRASQFHGYHDKIKARIGHKRATLATAHKLLRVIYAILRDDHPYPRPQRQLREPAGEARRIPLAPHAEQVQLSGRGKGSRLGQSPAGYTQQRRSSHPPSSGPRPQIGAALVRHQPEARTSHCCRKRSAPQRQENCVRASESFMANAESAYLRSNTL